MLFGIVTPISDFWKLSGLFVEPCGTEEYGHTGSLALIFHVCLQVDYRTNAQWLENSMMAKISWQHYI